MQRAQSALEVAARRQLDSRATSSNKRVCSAATELRGWCDGTPGAWGLDLQSVGPTELQWSLKEQWLPSHTGTSPVALDLSLQRLNHVCSFVNTSPLSLAI